VNQPLDLSRQTGQLDSHLLSSKAVAALGVGRNRTNVEMLAAAGVGRFFIGDHGIYDHENVSQCGISHLEVGKRKIDCVARAIRRINPRAKVETFFGIHSEFADLDALFSRHALVIDGTDSLAVARELSQAALRSATDTVHLKTTGDNRQLMITGTLRDYRGCVRCIHKTGCEAIANSHKPAQFYNSHRVVPENLNVKAVWIELGLLHHRAGSTLPIADIGRHFAELPAWIGYNGVTQDGEIFPVRAWREPLPSGWACPDCGTTAE